jgi:hypothetical protein
LAIIPSGILIAPPPPAAPAPTEGPDLVVRDKQGKPYSVRYDQVNAMLLNEFLKEHKASVEEHQKVERLEATVVNLLATVKEQAAQIQNVSAQLK